MNSLFIVFEITDNHKVDTTSWRVLIVIIKYKSDIGYQLDYNQLFILIK